MSEAATYRSITIEDVDRAIVAWFERKAAPYVEHPPDELRKVPITFATGERWAMIRDKRIIRDQNNTVILPLISIRRTGIPRDRSKSTLSTDMRRLVIARQVSPKTNIVQNAISSRSIENQARCGKVVYELTTIPFPDVCVAEYKVEIWAQYQTQMNKILEKIFSSFDIQSTFIMPVVDGGMTHVDSDTPWDDRPLPDGFYFVGYADTQFGDSGNLDEFSDSERVVKYTFDVTVPAYLQLDPEGTKPAVQVEFTAFHVGFTDEQVHFVDDPEELDAIFARPRPRTLPTGKA